MTRDEATAVLGKYDPDLPFEKWTFVGMCLHFAFNGSEEGLAVWDEWSAKGKKYKGREDCAAHWKNFGVTP